MNRTPCKTYRLTVKMNVNASLLSMNLCRKKDENSTNVHDVLSTEQWHFQRKSIRIKRQY